jgi:hypothetical protein
MASTPEELALELSRASLRAQERSEDQLRERATTVLSAASIAVPVAAVAVGGGPGIVAIPFSVAGVAYALCVRVCGVALFPDGVYSGLLGGEMLEAGDKAEANLREMQATAAHYLDRGYAYGEVRLEETAERIRQGVVLLTVEVAALVIALIVRLVS